MPSQITKSPNHQITNYRFSLPLSVRDYECDFQGIVNNAVYLNYLEHTRHEYARAVNLDVVELAQRGINVVVVRTEIDYKGSLRSGDDFVVGLDVSRLSRVRFVFEQEIYRLDEGEKKVPGKLILQAKVIATAINADGRPIIPPEVDVLF